MPGQGVYNPIVDYVAAIVEQGHAYESNGSVYMDVSKFRCGYISPYLPYISRASPLFLPYISPCLPYISLVYMAVSKLRCGHDYPKLEPYP